MAYQGALAIFLAFGMCVLVPLGFVAALVYVVTRRARARHEERMAMIAQGLVPPPDGPVIASARATVRGDPTRGLGWAVGLLVCGILWVAGAAHFAAMLIGAGAAFLTRGLLGLRRDAAGPPDPPLPPGESK
jgi:hypothetical protein